MHDLVAAIVRARPLQGNMRTACALMVALAFPLSAAAEEPWSADARHPVLFDQRQAATAPSALARTAPSAPARAADAAVRFFQRRISPYDGARCPLYPTCSDYARQALRRHGLLKGTLLAADRLLQEGEVHLRARPVRVYGFYRGYDPVEANDFWFSRRRLPPPLPPAGPGAAERRRLRRRPASSCCGVP